MKSPTDIWHVRYRRLNSPAFAKCARSRDFLRLLPQIASKANPSGWAILSDEFSKLPHRRDRRKKSPGVSASIGGDQIRRDRRIKSPDVSLALAVNYPKLFMIICHIYSLVWAYFRLVGQTCHSSPACSQSDVPIDIASATRIQQNDDVLSVFLSDWKGFICALTSLSNWSV